VVAVAVSHGRPLANLDVPRRAEILPFIESLRREFGLSIIYVSHNMDEIVRLADQLVVMAEGAVVAQGPMAEITARLYMTGARVPSAIVALLFAVHPLNVESVAWIAERKNVLSTTFWILSIASYAAYARRGGALRYLGAALLLAAGLLSKPMLVTLPLVFLLLDYWPLRRLAWGTKDAGGSIPACVPRSFGFLVLEKLPFLILSVASSWMTLYVQRSVVRSSDMIAWWERLANGTVAYARYPTRTPAHTHSLCSGSARRKLLRLTLTPQRQRVEKQKR
jgi:hypothetical protein